MKDWRPGAETIGDDTSMKTKLIAAVLIVGLLGPAARATLTNKWIGGTGTWVSASNWSLGAAPSASDAIDLISTSGINFVSLDASVTGLVSSLTITNLVLGPVGLGNVLSMFSVGTNLELRVINAFTIHPNGKLQMTNSILHVGSSLSAASVI